MLSQYKQNNNYLISFENRQEKETDRRIDYAWKSYVVHEDANEGRCTDFPEVQTHRYVRPILPILTYGAQTWSLTESQNSQKRLFRGGTRRENVEGYGGGLCPEVGLIRAIKKVTST